MSGRPDNIALFQTSGRYKPEAAKHTQGTFRPDRAKEEAQYTVVEKAVEPVAPDWMLDPRAQQYYCQAFKLLRDAGILTFADMGILEVYAVERAAIQMRYEQMYTKDVDPDTGVETLVINPHMAPGTEKINGFRTLSSELGFTPVSRHKTSPGKKPKKGEVDPWSNL